MLVRSAITSPRGRSLWRRARGDAERSFWEPSSSPSDQSVPNRYPTSGGTTRRAPGPQEVVFTPYAPQGTVLTHPRRDPDGGGHVRQPGGRWLVELPLLRPAGLDGLRPLFAPPHATSGPLMCVADPAEPEAVSFQVGTLPRRHRRRFPPRRRGQCNSPTDRTASSCRPPGRRDRVLSRAQAPPGRHQRTRTAIRRRRAGPGYEASCQTRGTASSTFRSRPGGQGLDLSSRAPWPLRDGRVAAHAASDHVGERPRGPTNRG